MTATVFDLTASELAAMKVAELRALATTHGIAGRSAMKRDDLLSALSALQAEGPITRLDGKPVYKRPESDSVSLHNDHLHPSHVTADGVAAGETFLAALEPDDMPTERPAQQNDIDAWLGDARADMTDEQYREFSERATRDPHGDWVAILESVAPSGNGAAPSVPLEAPQGLADALSAGQLMAEILTSVQAPETPYRPGTAKRKASKQGRRARFGGRVDK